MGLFKGFWSGQTELNEMMQDHADLVDETLEKFKEGMCLWVEEGDLEKANELAYETHSLEGKADDLRREIEMKLLNGALLARSRRPLLDVVERTDKLANAAEASMDFTLLQRIELPEELGPIAEDIVNQSVEIVEVVQEGLEVLFGGNGDVLQYTEEIEQLEGDIDDLERDFIQTLFGLDNLELAEKILLRQYLEGLVEISDRAEDLSDEMEIITATRKG
ncbi:TIGR00153 family protein [Candidatus Bipolaricaulota bacterium]|nr:TIGR00153 family protein [Candidatus Bipolaricaulota bacterium]